MSQKIDSSGQNTNQHDQESKDKLPNSQKTTQVFKSRHKRIHPKKRQYTEEMSNGDSWTCDEDYKFELNRMDCFRLRSGLIEVVEELKLRRNNDAENEEKIKSLVQEKYELERSLDNNNSKLVKKEGEKEKSLTELRRKYEDSVAVLEEKSRQDSVQREGLEVEIKALKDEIRCLQLSKYTLEKHLRDQERKLQVQSDSTEQHLHQLSIVEQKLQSFTKYCHKLFENQSRLQNNVKEAVDLNRTLMYVNQHQKCVVSQHETQIKDLRTQLLEARVRLESKPCMSTQVETQQAIDQLQQHLNSKTDEVEHLQKELDYMKTRYSASLEKIEDAHKLIERHLSNAIAHEEEATLLRSQKENLDKDITNLKDKLDDIQKELEVAQSKHQEDTVEWTRQMEEKIKACSELTADLETSKTTCEELEELNSSWAKQNLDLSLSLQEVKAKLEVPKSDTSDQTDLSLLNMGDQQCQTEFITATRQCQTDVMPSRSLHVQTTVPALTSGQTQTDSVLCKVSSTQTVVAPVTNSNTQTTVQYLEKSIQVQTHARFQGLGDCSERVMDSVIQDNITSLPANQKLRNSQMTHYSASQIADDKVQHSESAANNSIQTHTQDKRLARKDTENCSVDTNLCSSSDVLNQCKSTTSGPCDTSSLSSQNNVADLPTEGTIVIENEDNDNDTSRTLVEQTGGAMTPSRDPQIIRNNSATSSSTVRCSGKGDMKREIGSRQGEADDISDAVCMKEKTKEIFPAKEHMKCGSTQFCTTSFNDRIQTDDVSPRDKLSDVRKLSAPNLSKDDNDTNIVLRNTGSEVSPVVHDVNGSKKDMIDRTAPIQRSKCMEDVKIDDAMKQLRPTDSSNLDGGNNGDGMHLVPSNRKKSTRNPDSDTNRLSLGKQTSKTVSSGKFKLYQNVTGKTTYSGDGSSYMRHLSDFRSGPQDLIQASSKSSNRAQRVGKKGSVAELLELAVEQQTSMMAGSKFLSQEDFEAPIAKYTSPSSVKGSKVNQTIEESAKSNVTVSPQPNQKAILFKSSETKSETVKGDLSPYSRYSAILQQGSRGRTKGKMPQIQQLLLHPRKPAVNKSEISSDELSSLELDEKRNESSSSRKELKGFDNNSCSRIVQHQNSDNQSGSGSKTGPGNSPLMIQQNKGILKGITINKQRLRASKNVHFSSSPVHTKQIQDCTGEDDWSGEQSLFSDTEDEEQLKNVICAREENTLEIDDSSPVFAKKRKIE